MIDLRLLPQCIGLVRNRTVYGLPADYLMSLINPLMDYCYGVGAPLPVKFIKVEKSENTGGKLLPYSKALRCMFIPFAGPDRSIAGIEKASASIVGLARVQDRLEVKGEEALYRDALFIAIWMLKCYGAPGLAKYLINWTVRLAASRGAQRLDANRGPLPDWQVKRPMAVVSLIHLAETCATLDDLRALFLLTKPEPMTTQPDVPVKVAVFAKLVGHAELPPFKGTLFPDMGDAKLINYKAKVKVAKRKDGTIRYSVKEEDQSAGSSPPGDLKDGDGISLSCLQHIPRICRV